MEKRRLKNAKAAALAASYGVPLAQASRAVEEDAPRPTPPAQEKPGDPAGGKPAAQASSQTPAGRFLTSVELANEHHMSRDAMEVLLQRLGMRKDGHDGTTRYDESLLDRLLAAEDAKKLAAAAELVTAFTSNAALGEKIIREICDGATERWIVENDLRTEIADLKDAVWAQFRKSHAHQTHRRAGDPWRELAAIQEFGAYLLAATAERRQQKTQAGQ